MAIVVSDTSPLRCLAHIGRLDILEKVFQEVFIPPAVAAELQDSVRGDISAAIGAISCIRVRTPSDSKRVARLRETLDAGESEAIALAIELNIVTLLIDERAGRAIATAEGLHPLGVLGLLVGAKRQGLVTAVRPLVERLRDTGGFHVSDGLFAHIIKLAGE